MMDRHLASIMLSLAILVLLFMFDASSGANTDETNRANVAEEGTDDLAADRAACIKEVATELKPLDKLYILPDAQVMKRLDEARRYYEVEGEISLGPEELKSCVELRGQFQKVLDGQGECFKGINPLSPKWIVPTILQEADEQTKLRFEALYACEWGRFTGPSIEPDIYEAIVGSRRVEADDDDDEFFETKSRFDDESDSDDEEYHESDDLFGDEADFNDDNDDDDDVFHESKRHFEDEADSDGEEKFLEVKDYLDADIIKSDNDYEDQIKTSKCFEKVLPLIKSEIQIDDPTLMERVEDAQKHYAYAREDIPHYGGEQLDACVRLKVRLNEIFISTDCLNDNNLIGIPIEVKFREIASVDENARHVLETFYACQEGRYAGHKLRDLKLFDVITAPLRGAQ